MVPPPESPPLEIAHHGYEYGDCALPVCVSPSDAAAMRKSTMIGLRVIVPLLSSFLIAFILAALPRRRNEHRARPGALKASPFSARRAMGPSYWLFFSAASWSPLADRTSSA